MRKRNFCVLVCLFLVAGIFLFKTKVRGAGTSIAITEIAAYESSGFEWVEIYNKGDEPIDLTDWKFWEGEVNHTLSLIQGEDSLIEPGEYALIVQDDQKFISSYPFITTTIFDSSWGSLNESGEEIGLKDMDGEFVELFTYIESATTSLQRKDVEALDYTELNWQPHPTLNTVGEPNAWPVPPPPEPEPNQLPVPVIMSVATSTVSTTIQFDGSESYDPDGEIVKFLWDFGDPEGVEGVTTTYSFTTTGTVQVILTVIDNEGEESSTTTEIIIEPVGSTLELTLPPTTTSTPPLSPENKVVINEFVSDPPSGEKEWIELFNPTTSTIDLTNAKLYDGAGKLATLSGTVSSSGFVVVELTSSKLNNGGDIIILKDASDQMVDQVIYDGADYAPTVSDPNSVARISDGRDTDNDRIDFAETIIPTRGMANIISLPVVEQPVGETLEFPLTPQTTPTKTTYPDHIILTEVFPDPEGVDDAEFIEIKNTGTETLDLEGWKLGDRSSKRFTIIETKIKPGEYLSLKKSETKISLNNSGGDEVKLFNPNGELVDSTEYEKAETGQSWSLDSGEWRWSLEVTEGEKNIIKEEEVVEEITEVEVPDKETTQTSTTTINFELIEQVEFSEILPNPVGSDTTGEFIELWNPTSSTISLAGFKLDDEDGGSKPFTIPEGTEIKASEYLVFDRPQTGLALNNSSDSVRFLTPDDEVLLEIKFSEVKEGLSYIKDKDGKWVWTSEVTKGKENKFTLPEQKIAGTKISTKPIIYTIIENVRGNDLGDMVSLRGVVAVKPGVLGSQYFYIVSTNTTTSAGVQIYMYKKDFPTLAVGDVVEVVGEIAETGGEIRIKTKEKMDIKKVGVGSNPEPYPAQVAEIGEGTEGWLVQVAGEVTQVKGSYMYIDDGSEEVKVYFKSGTGINKSTFGEGDLIKVAGIVNQTKTGYQILPRFQADITKTGVVEDVVQKLETQEKDAQKEMAEKYLTATAGGLTSVLFGLFVKSKGSALGTTWENIIKFIKKKK